MRLILFILGIVLGVAAVVYLMDASVSQTLAEAQRLQSLAEVERVRGEALVNLTNARADAFVDKAIVAAIILTAILSVSICAAVAGLVFYALHIRTQAQVFYLPNPQTHENRRLRRPATKMIDMYYQPDTRDLGE